MKIETKVTEITHDDLVLLLSTASEGSSWLAFSYKKSDYEPLKNEDDCFEDKLAKILLAGKSIEACDYYAEGEVYGNLPFKIHKDDEIVCYKLTLEDIKRGLEKAFSSKSYISTYAYHLVEDEGMQLDQPEAEALMQYILFGEEIYG